MRSRASARGCASCLIFEKNVPESKLTLHPSSFGKEGSTVINVGASVSTKSILWHLNMPLKCFHCIIVFFFISLPQILKNEVEEGTIQIMFYKFYKIVV